MRSSNQGNWSGYDIIGDIHGCTATLKALLAKMHYRCEDGVYFHPERQAIFIGDLIDRGPGQREAVELVRAMIRAGTAQLVLGNHEFNAIAWFTPDDENPGAWLRAHSEKNRKQHQAFLDAYAADPDEYAEVISWFRSLPMWLDLEDLKIVHACWDNQHISAVSNAVTGGNCVDDKFLKQACRRETWQFQAVETLLKGKELPLPDGAGFHDKDGHLRHDIRVRWWDRGASTYRQAYMGPETARTHIPDDDIHGSHLVDYAHDAPPVFLGHYWLEGEPAPLAGNIACVDYSVARENGKLVAYRWDGEQILDAGKFVGVKRIDR